MGNKVFLPNRCLLGSYFCFLCRFKLESYSSKDISLSKLFCFSVEFGFAVFSLLNQILKTDEIKTTLMFVRNIISADCLANKVLIFKLQLSLKLLLRILICKLHATMSFSSAWSHFFLLIAKKIEMSF